MNEEVLAHWGLLRQIKKKIVALCLETVSATAAFKKSQQFRLCSLNWHVIAVSRAVSDK